jgi:hypothetical protein
MIQTDERTRGPDGLVHDLSLRFYPDSPVRFGACDVRIDKLDKTTEPTSCMLCIGKQHD